MTAEGCGDNGQALNDALEAPQVNPLHPGARDYAVAQRRQHYLQHQQQTAVGQRGANKGCEGGGEEVVEESEGEQKDIRENREEKE